MDAPAQDQTIAKHFQIKSSITKVIFTLLTVSLISGIGTGYFLSTKTSANPLAIIPGTQPKTAEQDVKTFRDFAEGTIKPIKTTGSDEYVEGTHFLERDGATPVTLTSSVVDLTQYEGKKVKVYGETQKAVKSGWLMDVGKVEEIK